MGGQGRVRAFLSLASEFCSSGFKLDERPPLNPLLGLRPFVKENNKESPFKVLPWNNTKRPQFFFDFKPSFRWLFLKLAPIFDLVWFIPYEFQSLINDIQWLQCRTQKNNMLKRYYNSISRTEFFKSQIPGCSRVRNWSLSVVRTCMKNS